jgi:FkbM family methyltransferase
VPGSPLASMTLRQMVGRSLNWLRYLANRSSRSSRFVPLTPPFLKHQLIYDRITGKTFAIWMRNAIDHLVLGGVFLQRDYEFGFSRDADIRNFYQSALAAGKTPLIIDCGANSGMATRYFRETYPAAHVVAVEPDSGNLEQAILNNPGPAAEFLLAGIGCENARADIVNQKDANWAFQTQIRDGGAVDIVSVDSILVAHPDMVPFIIKIDIEGFEDNLFSSHTQWIERFPALVIELHDWMLPKAGTAKNFLREIAKLDRDFLYRGENVFSISNKLL